MSSLDPCYVLRGLSGSVTSLSSFNLAKVSTTHGLVSGFANGVVKIWDLSIRRAIEELTSHDGKPILKVSFSSQENFLTHGRNGTVILWNSNGNNCHIPTAKFSCSDLTFCPCAIQWNTDQGHLIACPSKDIEKTKVDIIKIENDTSNTSSIVIPKKKGMLMHLCWYQDSGNDFKLLIGHEDGSVALWDISLCRECTSIKFFDDPVMCMDADSSGHVVAGSSGNTLKSSQILNNEGVFSFTKYTETTTKHHGNGSLRIRNDQRIFAAGGWDGRIRIFSLKKMRFLAVLKYHTETVNCIDFTSDGYLVAGCKDGKITVWSVYRQNTEGQS